MTGHAVPFGKSRLHRFVSDDGRRGCSFFARGDRVAAVGVIVVIASRRETERMDGGWPCRARALTRGRARIWATGRGRRVRFRVGTDRRGRFETTAKPVRLSDDRRGGIGGLGSRERVEAARSSGGRGRPRGVRGSDGRTVVFLFLFFVVFRRRRRA